MVLHQDRNWCQDWFLGGPAIWGITIELTLSLVYLFGSFLYSRLATFNELLALKSQYIFTHISFPATICDSIIIIVHILLKPVHFVVIKYPYLQTQNILLYNTICG